MTRKKKRRELIEVIRELHARKTAPVFPYDVPEIHTSYHPIERIKVQFEVPTHPIHGPGERSMELRRRSACEHLGRHLDEQGFLETQWRDNDLTGQREVVLIATVGKIAK